MEVSFAGDVHGLMNKLAYEYWERRGRPLGSPEKDWCAAEKAIESARAHGKDDFSLYSLRLGADECSHR